MNIQTLDELLIKEEIDKWLFSQTGKTNPKEAILTLTKDVLNEYKNSVGNLDPPIDLNVLGVFLGIKNIILTNRLGAEAILIPIKSGFIIKVKKSSKLPRIRYSCAHEMTHTFFYQKYNKSTPQRAVPIESKYEEELCEISAAEFLMPLDIFKQRCIKRTNKYGYSCKTIFKLAMDFRTSVHSVSRRLIKSIEGMWNDYIIVNWTNENNQEKTKLRVTWFMKSSGVRYFIPFRVSAKENSIMKEAHESDKFWTENPLRTYKEITRKEKLEFGNLYGEYVIRAAAYGESPKQVLTIISLHPDLSRY